VQPLVNTSVFATSSYLNIIRYLVICKLRYMIFWLTRVWVGSFSLYFSTKMGVCFSSKIKPFAYKQKQNISNRGIYAVKPKIWEYGQGSYKSRSQIWNYHQGKGWRKPIPINWLVKPPAFKWREGINQINRMRS